MLDAATLRAIQTALGNLGLYKGAIDGRDGPQTRAAVSSFQRANGLAADGIPGPRTQAVLFSDKPAAGAPTAYQWPRQSDVRAFFGEPGNPACTAGMCDLPFPMKIAWDTNQIIRRFRCHSKVEKAFESIFQQTLAHYGEARIRALGLDLFGGCYNLRQMRGGTAWSMHAFGIAVDIDPANNQLRWNKTKARFAKPEYEPFWRIVEAHGMVSLGRARDFDWQHFQAARL